MPSSTTGARATRRSQSEAARSHAGTIRMRVFQIAAALAALAYVASLLLAQHRVPAAVASERWSYNAFFILLIPPILLRARHSPRLGFGWTAIGLFAILYELGNLADYLPVGGARQLRVPPSSEMCYLASFIALVVGIAWLTQRTFGARMLSVRLDGAIVALAIGSAAAAVRFQSIPTVSGGALQAAVSTSHPLLDLVLLMLIVAGLALKSYRPPWPAATLMLGVAACVIGDVLYTHQDGAHSFIGLPILNGTWIFGLCLISLAAWADPEQRTGARAQPPALPHGLLMLPIGSGLVALSVIVLSLLSYVPRIALVLAACSLLLVIVRMALTLRDGAPAGHGELPGRAHRRADGAVATGGPSSRTMRCAVERPRTRRLGVILVDLNGFKEINDSLGHACGDELLRVVAKRFASMPDGRGPRSRGSAVTSSPCTFDVDSMDERSWRSPSETRDDALRPDLDRRRHRQGRRELSGSRCAPSTA